MKGFGVAAYGPSHLVWCKGPYAFTSKFFTQGRREGACCHKERSDSIRFIRIIRIDPLRP